MNYVLMLVGGFLGIFLYSLRKVKSINSRLPDETYKSVFRAYWKKDWPSIAVSIVTVITVVFISSEYLDISPEDPSPISGTVPLAYKIGKFIKTLMVVVGFCANSAVDMFLGRTEQKLAAKAKEGGGDIVS